MTQPNTCYNGASLPIKSTEQVQSFYHASYPGTMNTPSSCDAFWRPDEENASLPLARWSFAPPNGRLEATPLKGPPLHSHTPAVYLAPERQWGYTSRSSQREESAVLFAPVVNDYRDTPQYATPPPMSFASTSYQTTSYDPVASSSHWPPAYTYTQAEAPYTSLTEAAADYDTFPRATADRPKVTDPCPAQPAYDVRDDGLLSTDAARWAQMPGQLPQSNWSSIRSALQPPLVHPSTAYSSKAEPRSPIPISPARTCSPDSSTSSEVSRGVSPAGVRRTTTEAPGPLAAPAKTCSHCKATATPLWRRDPKTLQTLCNACGLYLQQRHKARPQALIDADAMGDEPEEPGRWGGPECSHCHTRQTSVWRRSKTGAQLCNACGVYVRLRGKDRPLSLKRNRIKPRSKHTAE